MDAFFIARDGLFFHPPRRLHRQRTSQRGDTLQYPPGFHPFISTLIHAHHWSNQQPGTDDLGQHDAFGIAGDGLKQLGPCQHHESEHQHLNAGDHHCDPDQSNGHPLPDPGGHDGINAAEHAPGYRKRGFHPGQSDPLIGRDTAGFDAAQPVDCIQ